MIFPYLLLSQIDTQNWLRQVDYKNGYVVKLEL